MLVRSGPSFVELAWLYSPPICRQACAEIPPRYPQLDMPVFMGYGEKKAGCFRITVDARKTHKPPTYRIVHTVARS
jgi:hypothetical protein